MKRVFVGAVFLALAGLALSATADENAWRKINYPRFVKQMPRMRGAMLGRSGEKEFQDLSAMGANLVRYQMIANWNSFTNTENEVVAYRDWLNGRLDHLDEMLPWARQYGIRICVDLHVHLGGFTKEKYSSDMIFADKKYEDVLVLTWKKIARRFKGNHDIIYGYDLFNEPIDRENKLTRTTWRAVMCRTIDAIRAIDPVTPIVIEPNCNASPRGFDVKNIYGLSGFEPLPYDNLIYSVHVYQPIGFTHQGIHKRKDEYLHHSYPTTQAKLDENRERFPGDLGKDTGKPEDWNKEFVREQINSVREFQLKTGARIFVGEFSAAAWTDGGAQYLQDVTDLFEEYGWDYTYHAFRESNIWSLEHEGEDNFSLKVKTDGDTDRMKVMKAKWALNER